MSAPLPSTPSQSNAWLRWREILEEAAFYDPGAIRVPYMPLKKEAEEALAVAVVAAGLSEFVRIYIKHNDIGPQLSADTIYFIPIR